MNIGVSVKVSNVNLTAASILSGGGEPEPDPATWATITTTWATETNTWATV